MKSRSIIVILALLINSFNCFPQLDEYNLDTASFYYTCKLNVVRFNNLIINRSKIETIDSLINSNLFKVVILKNKGFDNFIFAKVSFAEDEFHSFLKTGRQTLKNPYYFDFILVYDVKREMFYKLKGFVHNEFTIFFSNFISSSSTLEKEILLGRKGEKYFIKNYYIDEIDLECLIHNKKFFDWKSPCLTPSPSRVINVNGSYMIQ